MKNHLKSWSSCGPQVLQRDSDLSLQKKYLFRTLQRDGISAARFKNKEWFSVESARKNSSQLVFSLFVCCKKLACQTTSNLVQIISLSLIISLLKKSKCLRLLGLLFITIIDCWWITTYYSYLGRDIAQRRLNIHSKINF